MAAEEKQINKALPKDWKWVKLEDVCDIISGKNQSKVINENGIYPIYGSSGIFGYANEYLCNEGTTVVGRKGTINSPLYVNTKFWNVDTAFGLSPKGNYHNKLLYYFCLGFNFHKLDKSTTIPSLAKRDLLNIDIPLPPIDVQRKIVSKIEELFSELDKGIENLRLAQQQLKTYRQAVLKWAFEGRLTNENVQEGELPIGWKIEKLGNVSEMCLGKMLDKQKNKGKLKPYLGNINVRWGEFRLDELKQMPFEEEELDRYSLKKGDLVICEGGEPGRCAIWKTESSTMMIQKALHRIRVSSQVDVRYVYYFLFYNSMTGVLSKYITGTTIKHLTGKELRKIQIPLPLLEEQENIILEIESRISVADNIDESITHSLQQSLMLKQSVLQMALSGKLK